MSKRWSSENKSKQEENKRESPVPSSWVPKPSLEWKQSGNLNSGRIKDWKKETVNGKEEPK